MSKLRTRAVGAVGLLAVAGVVAALLGMYQKVFTPVTEITVMSDRAGLLLDRGGSVRAFGLPVGEIQAVRQTDGDQVEIAVGLDPEDAERIPADVTASIKSTTVFGAKFVDLEVPEGALDSSTHIAAGDVVEANAVTVEANDTFQHSIELIEAVEPMKLNATLSSVANALEGRGSEIGRYLELLNTYLTSLNAHLPQLEADIGTVDDVLRSYNKAAPHLIDAADQAGTTSVTLDENLATMQTFLVDIVNASDQTERLLAALEKPLARAIKELTPVTDLLRVFAPGLGCFLENTAAMVEVVALGLGKVDPGVQGRAGFFPGQRRYEPELNMPKIVTGVGPVCYPFPTEEDPVPPHVRFDDGTQDIYDGVGPVVNPGTLNDPYGNTYDPTKAEEPKTYEGFVRYLLGDAAGKKVADRAENNGRQP